MDQVSFAGALAVVAAFGLFAATAFFGDAIAVPEVQPRPPSVPTYEGLPGYPGKFATPLPTPAQVEACSSKCWDTPLCGMAVGRCMEKCRVGEERYYSI